MQAGRVFNLRKFCLPVLRMKLSPGARINLPRVVFVGVMYLYGTHQKDKLIVWSVSSITPEALPHSWTIYCACLFKIIPPC